VEPSVGLPHQHLSGVRCEADTVVAEVEPPHLSIRVVGGHGAHRVQLLALSRSASVRPPRSHRPTRPLLARGESMKLAAEKVDPEIPVRRDTQKSLAEGSEEGCVRDGIGGKVVKLHPVMVAQPPHEAARRGGEAALVQPDEVDDIAVGSVGLPIRCQ
jgi:hypothetical protein